MGQECDWGIGRLDNDDLIVCLQDIKVLALHIPVYIVVGCACIDR